MSVPTVRDVEGRLVIDWPVPWPASWEITAEAFEALIERANDNAVLAGLMRQILTADDIYIDVGENLLIDGTTDVLTDEERDVVSRLMDERRAARFR